MRNSLEYVRLRVGPFFSKLVDDELFNHLIGSLSMIFIVIRNSIRSLEGEVGDALGKTPHCSRFSGKTSALLLEDF